MWLNRWNQWLFVLICTLAWLPESGAQDENKPLSKLDQLRMWYPTRRSSPPNLPNDFVASPYSYETIDDLLQKAKEGNKIEALIISGLVLKQGNLASLSQLQTVRVLDVNDLTAPQTDSLFRAIQDWPVLERLTIGAHSFPNAANPSVRPVTLPGSLQRFQNLQEVRINGNNIQWHESLVTLAGLKSLRSLTIQKWGPDNEQPVTISQLPQLNELSISGQGWFLKPEVVTNLKQLRRLSLATVKVDTATFQRILNGLPSLETLSLQDISSLKALELNELKTLKSLELSNNRDLSIKATAFTNLTSLERLVIQRIQSVDLTALCPLTHLHTLQLSGNGLSGKSEPINVPDCVGQLTQLRELRLENLSINRMPAFGALSQLQKLSIIYCGLDSLSVTSNQLGELQELNVTANKLRQLPALGSLRALERLTVANNQLTTLPDDLGQLTRLTRLEADQNKLTQLPASIGRLVGLKDLSLMNNLLERLPDEISKLRKLQSLSLDNNQLTALPDNMDRLDSLRYLSIGKNRLHTLPASLFRLKNLMNLQIGVNELTTLPSNIGALRQLTSLTIQTNPITELPASISELRNLRSLNISGTKLRLLPDNIGALTKLQYVYLSNNELIALPGSIGQWQDVTMLFLENNRLEGLPNSIGRLSRLNNLTISGKDKVSEGATGGIRQLPDSIVHCSRLRQLTIQQQPQLDANDVFTKAAQLSELISLQITDCNVRQLPEIAWKKVTWQNLNIARNLLTELPVGLLDVPSLQTVSANENRLPEPLDRDFYDKEALRVAFVEAGIVPIESLSKPNRKIAIAFQQMATQKARQRDWTGALSDLEKAINYAPDTILAFPYGQRASFHFFRKEFAEALADYDKAIQYAPLLRKDKLSDTSAANRALVSFWQQKAIILGTMGQNDAALTAITKAESLLPATDNTPMTGSVHTEHGRYLALKDKPAEADSSYRKAIRAYEKLAFVEPGIGLTIVELSVLTGQYDRAQQAITKLRPDQIREGYAVLKEYLERCVAVLKNNQTGAQAIEQLTDYLAKHPAKVYGWSFDLFDNWLSRSKLTTDKTTALRQLTDITKERLVKPQ